MGGGLLRGSRRFCSSRSLTLLRRWRWRRIHIATDNATSHASNHATSLALTIFSFTDFLDRRGFEIRFPPGLTLLELVQQRVQMPVLGFLFPARFILHLAEIISLQVRGRDDVVAHVIGKRIQHDE